jgi:hypothetical protein
VRKLNETCNLAERKSVSYAVGDCEALTHQRARALLRTEKPQGFNALNHSAKSPFDGKRHIIVYIVLTDSTCERNHDLYVSLDSQATAYGTSCT